MADVTERRAGKPAASDSKAKAKKGQGGRVVKSRYLQYEKKVKEAPAAAADTGRGKLLEARKARPPQRSQEASSVGNQELQSTLLEGHGTAPPDLEVSAIGDRSLTRTDPHLDRTGSRKVQSKYLATPQNKSVSQRRSPEEAMDMMESQTLLLTLLTVKMEQSVGELERQAERELELVWAERERLQRHKQQLQRHLLLSQKQRELDAALGAQLELLEPLRLVLESFRDRYQTLATALDITRHELPVRGIHLEASGQDLLDELQPVLRTTQRLLGGLRTDAEASGTSQQILLLAHQLKEIMVEKDLELRRSIPQVLELSAQASKGAALTSQEGWEVACGAPACSRWYFSRDSAEGGECP